MPPEIVTQRVLRGRINKVVQARIDYAMAVQELHQWTQGTYRRPGRTRQMLELRVRRNERTLVAARDLLEDALARLFPDEPRFKGQPT